MNRNEDNTRISLGPVSLLLGAAIGTLAGMLLARRSGKTLRRELTKAHNAEGLGGAVRVLKDEFTAVGQDVSEHARSMTAEQAEHLQEMKTRMREKANALLDRGKSKADSALDAADDSLHRFRRKANKKMDDTEV